MSVLNGVRVAFCDICGVMTVGAGRQAYSYNRISVSGFENRHLPGKGVFGTSVDYDICGGCAEWFYMRLQERIGEREKERAESIASHLRSIEHVFRKIAEGDPK